MNPARKTRHIALDDPVDDTLKSAHETYESTTYAIIAHIGFVTLGSSTQIYVRNALRKL